METSAYTLIEKEKIPLLHFLKLIEVDQSLDLRIKLNNATALGNNYHSKVKIYFQDDDGLKRVDTTIWATGTKFICLKGGVWLPIDRIVDIEY